MSQRHLTQLLRIIVFSCPISKARAEAMYYVPRHQFIQHFHHLAGVTWKKLSLAITHQPQLFFCKRHMVLFPSFIRSAGMTHVSPFTRVSGNLAMRANSLGDLISDRVAPSDEYPPMRFAEPTEALTDRVSRISCRLNRSMQHRH